MATTDQLRKAEGRGLIAPPLNSFKRGGWVRIIMAMDEARYGRPTEVITWRMTRAHLHGIVAKRLMQGETFPSRSAWQKETP